jgi:hypothetical protein
MPGDFYFSFFSVLFFALFLFSLGPHMGYYRVSTQASKPRVLRMTLEVRRNVSERNKGVKEKHPSARVL